MKQTILTIILALTLFAPAQFWQQDKTPKQTETVSDTVANNDDEGIAAYSDTTSDDTLTIDTIQASRLQATKLTWPFKTNFKSI